MKKKKNLIIIALCFMLTFMGAGYAILSASLKISGTNNVKGKWDVHIKSITPTTVNGMASSNSITINNNGLGASLSVNLYNNNDLVEYTIVVENAGNIPAKLSVFNITSDFEEEHIKVTSTAENQLDKKINANSTMTFTITFKLDNPNNDEISEILGLYYYFDLLFVQDTGV